MTIRDFINNVSATSWWVDQTHTLRVLDRGHAIYTVDLDRHIDHVVWSPTSGLTIII